MLSLVNSARKQLVLSAQVYSMKTRVKSHSFEEIAELRFSKIEKKIDRKIYRKMISVLITVFCLVSAYHQQGESTK